MEQGKAGRRMAAVLCAVVLMLFLGAGTPVRANSAPPSPSICFQLTNLPEGTVYVDLLIRLPEQDPYYVDTIRENIPGSFAQDAEILTWCKDDYRSYTFHYRDALSLFRVNEKGSVWFFEGEGMENGISPVFRYDHADEIIRRGEIRLAMLDAGGNILKLSPLLDLRPRMPLAYVSHVYHYDAESGRLESEDRLSSYAVVGYLILCVLTMGLTCLVELGVALIFRLVDRYGRLIGKVNLISQLLMHVSYLALYSLVFWRYAYATILLEILVFAGEYLYYRRTMEGVSRFRCLAYTVAANAASLMIGLGLMKMARM